jgi:hypothetical protein
VCAGTITILSAAGVLAGFAQQARRGPAAAVKACSLLPAAEVKKLAGVTNPMFDSMPPREEPLDKGSSCHYVGITTQVDAISPSTVDELAKDAKSKWTRVAGVGDAAYFRDNDGSYGEVAARVGTRTLTVQLSIPMGSSAEKLRPGAISLATALLAKMR